MCAGVKSARPPRAKGAAKLIGPLGEFTLNSERRPSCSVACPAGIDVKAYVNLIADRRYEEAVSSIRRANPFPGVCGRVCTHPCEDECARGDSDDPVAIRALKRFASDYERTRRPTPTSVAPKKRRGKKVAVVGAGLAGLTAALDLTKIGLSVTVFDSSKSAGGILAWGIPSFRLPKDIVRAEVARIAEQGVEIRMGEEVRDPLSLLKKGYSAVIIAAGCMAPLPMGVDGEGCAGVMDCIDFLKRASDGQLTALKGRAVVVGGGNAALDAARVALRLGADVTVAYRRTKAEMPADDSEVSEAREEGVRFEFLVHPKRVVSEKGQVRGLEVLKARLGELDKSGRRASVAVPGSEFVIDADWIIRAVGNKPDDALVEKIGLRMTPRGAISIDDKGRTSAKGVFAAGDVALGPATVVEAIGSGHAAARGVGEFLDTVKPSAAGNADENLVMETAVEKRRRAEPRKANAASRKSSFEEIETALDELSAVAEASRCRRCGLCSECDVCLAGCEHRQAILIAEGEKPSWIKVPLDVSIRLSEKPSAREGWLLSREGREIHARLEPMQAIVDESLCISCGICEDACAYSAIRTRFSMDEPPAAVIDPTGCRACGACAAVCPTGAISQGFMDDRRLVDGARRAAREAAGGVVSFSCIWGRGGSLEQRKAEVPVVCTRRLSPVLVLEALASGVSGVALVGCEEEKCHYLPGPIMGADLPSRVGSILESVGIDPRRVRYFSKPGGGAKPLEDYAKELAKAGLHPISDVAGKIPESRSAVGRCVSLGHALMARQDKSNGRQAKAKHYLASGCSPICDSVLEAHGIAGTSRFLAGVEALLSAMRIDFARGARLLGPGSSLKSWSLDGLYKDYGKAALAAVKSSGAKRVVCISAEAMEKFDGSWEGDFGPLPFEFVPLPSILNKSARKGIFRTTPGKVAFHPACGGRASQGKSILGLLAKVPGLEVQVLDAPCGQTGWRSPGRDSLNAARRLAEEAASTGATALVVESHQCLSHLAAVSATWKEVGPEATDVYSFLASRLSGVGARGR